MKADVSRPLSYEEFDALNLAGLWVAAQESVEAGWTMRVEVFNRVVWVDFTCEPGSRKHKKLPRIVGFGRMVEAAVTNHYELHFHSHCGCGECENFQVNGYHEINVRVVPSLG